MCYNLQPDWSLLLFVYTQGSLHHKQGSLQETSFLQLPVNLQFPAGTCIWEKILNCYYRNKSEIENA